MPRRKAKPRGILVATRFTGELEAFEVTIDVNGNEVARLGPAQVLEHVNGVQAAAARAAYDAAIYQQAVDRGWAPHRASVMVNEMRGARPPLDLADTEPLVFHGVLNAHHEARVTVSLARTTLGRWSLFQADQYSLSLLAAQQTAENETAFHLHLKGLEGVTPDDTLTAVTNTGTFHTI